MTTFKETYNLKLDKAHIKRVQDASMDASLSGGLKIENGLLYGTQEWFKAIETGQTPTYKVTGTISKVYMSGHNDYSEFEVDSSGVKTYWTQEGTDSDYVTGRQVQITYVKQKFKRGAPTDCVISIHISSD